MDYNAECIACGSKEFIPIAHNSELNQTREVIRCKVCGLAFVYPLPSSQELESFYVKEYSSGHKSYKKKSPVDCLNNLFSSIFLNLRLKERIKFLVLKKIELANKEILEIGSSGGAFLNRLRKQKAAISGIEPSRIESELSRKRFGILPGAKETAELLPEHKAKYDIIFSYHILEHLNDPLAELKNIRQLLKKGGLLIGEVPATPKNPTNLSPAIKKSVFDNLHLFHYNPKAISGLFNKAGFSDIKVERIELSSIVKKVYSEANIHYLHPSFEKGPLTKFFSFLQAGELILKSFIGLSVMKPQKSTDLDSQWKGPNDWIRFLVKN